MGSFGLDLSARKLSVMPGDDFYTYANGAWVDSFVIPPDRSSYGSFTKLAELSEQRVPPERVSRGSPRPNRRPTSPRSSAYPATARPSVSPSGRISRTRIAMR